MDESRNTLHVTRYLPTDTLSIRWWHWEHNSLSLSYWYFSPPFKLRDNWRVDESTNTPSPSSTVAANVLANLSRTKKESNWVKEKVWGIHVRWELPQCYDRIRFHVRISEFGLPSNSSDKWISRRNFFFFTTTQFFYYSPISRFLRRRRLKQQYRSKPIKNIPHSPPNTQASTSSVSQAASANESCERSKPRNSCKEIVLSMLN